MAADAKERLRLSAARMSMVFLSAALACSVIASCLVIVEFHDHDCTGDECPICLLLATAQTVLSSVAAPAVAGCIFIGFAAMAFYSLALRVSLLSAETPVTRGVKLII